MAATLRRTVGNKDCVVNAACACVQDKIYSFGGFHFVSDVVFNDLHVLSIGDGTWRQVSHIRGQWPVKRTDHTMTLWGTDRHRHFGGSDTNEVFLNDVFVLHLNHLTWERLDCSGCIPVGRAKHSAVIHNDRLIVSGGACKKDDDITNEVNVLDLRTCVWDSPVRFVRRHAHTSWIFRNRLYIYGGFDENMDRVKSLSYLDLESGTSVIVSIDSLSAPNHMEQQFVECFGKDMLVVGVPLHWRGAEGTAQLDSSGIWALDLDRLRWRRLAGGHLLQSFVWHYHIINTTKPHIYLLGENPTGDEDGFMSNILTINLEFYGIHPSLGGTLAADMAALFASGNLADFKISSSAAPDSPPLPVHRLLLMTRWPFFANLVSSTLSEASSGVLALPDSPEAVAGFVRFLYTDQLPPDLASGHLAEIMVMANRYCLEHLQRMCAASLLDHPASSDPLQVFVCATRARELLLRDRALAYILAHFGVIARSQEFRSLPPADIDELWNSLPEQSKIVTSQSQSSEPLSGSSVTTSPFADPGMDVS
ncbi:hypothetical protein HK105_204619 [Polyrhizophydium stewartii]|uniref:BTB domain-containing protein n=1 Tax=Polyrhizophydium stewartii TaxID=2732419 RepID=A0ABR4N8S1_9FUNG